jgi:hypothetical protein
MVAAAGILFFMIVMTNVSPLTAWVMRITVSREPRPCPRPQMLTINTGRRSSDPLRLRHIPSCAPGWIEATRLIRRLPALLGPV